MKKEKSNYPVLRERVRSGDVLAWKGKGLGSRIIRWGTNSPYTHVGIAQRVGNRVMVLEAMPGGVRMMPLSKRLPAYHVPVDRTWDDERRDRAWQDVGLGYSYIDALITGIRAYTGIRMKTRMPGRHCSEYVGHVLGIAGNPSPGEVVRACKNIGEPMLLK